MEEIDYRKLLENSKLPKGVVVDLVVDVFNVSKEAMKQKKLFDANHFIDAAFEYIGEEGTLLIRAFNWDFCHDVPFDVRKTPSQVGALGNVAMKRPDFARTQHPLYSWFVKGKYAKELLKIDEQDAFGPDSIFAWEHHREDSYQLNVGNPRVFGLTLIHYMEQVLKVPYRYTKFFTCDYCGYDGVLSKRTYSMYVRDLSLQIDTDDSVYMPAFLDKGIRIDSENQGICTNLFSIKKLCEEFEQDYLTNGKLTGVTVTKINE